MLFLSKSILIIFLLKNTYFQCTIGECKVEYSTSGDGKYNIIGLYKLYQDNHSKKYDENAIRLHLTLSCISAVGKKYIRYGCVFLFFFFLFFFLHLLGKISKIQSGKVSSTALEDRLDYKSGGQHIYNV